MKKIYFYAFLTLTAGSVLLSNKSAAQIMTFDNPVLTSGVDNAVGATYRFSNVKPGVDAIVTIDSLLNGAVIKSIDKTGWGYLEAFQPFIQPPNGVNASAYAVFTMKFVVTSTVTPYVVPLLAMTALDIDGSNNIKEFDVINMGGGTASYSSTPSEISITAQSSAFRGINISGIQHGGPDTTEKGDIFTVTKASVSQLTLKCGTVGTTNSNTTRQYSFFPGSVSYPLPIFTLPLNLISFTATLNKEGNSADIKWTTAKESNVSHFVVEKSFDGKNFSDAALVFAHGSLSEKADYSFSDNLDNTQNNIIYYRLRSVDNDGKSQYFELRIIRIGKKGDGLNITVYPNPASSELRITVPSTWQGKAVLFELFNQSGQRMKARSSASSNQTESLTISDLARGFYIIKATCGTDVTSQQITKQ